MSRKAKLLLQIFAAGILGLTLVVAGLFFFKDDILRRAAIRQIESQTDLSAGLGRLHIGVREPVFHLENLALTNSAEFGATTFLRVPELHVEYDREALAENRLRLKQVRIHVAELNIVKNKEGKTNITEIYQQLEEKAQERTGKSSSSRTNDFPYEFLGVDELALTVGTIRLTDLRNTNESQVFNIGVTNHIARNVKTEDELHAALVIVLLKSGARHLLVPSSNRASPLEWLLR